MKKIGDPLTVKNKIILYGYSIINYFVLIKLYDI